MSSEPQSSGGSPERSQQELPEGSPAAGEGVGRAGILFVLSAPSGTGKTSLCRELIDIFPNLRQSVSFTTRPMREGEQDGIDYHFISRDTFEGMVRQGAFAEWAEVHGNLYGTSMETLNDCRRRGQDVLLDIDCQGANQLRERRRCGVFIFILPPNLEELRRRLEGRQTDAPEIIARRTANAREEIRQAAKYDYLVINDDFALAVQELKSIVLAEGCRTSRVLPVVARIFDL